MTKSAIYTFEGIHRNFPLQRSTSILILFFRYQCWAVDQCIDTNYVIFDISLIA